MLSTNDVGRRNSNISGRSSQNTVGSGAESTIDSSDENRFIPSPPAPRRRRIRCLVPMLLAIFVVLAAVVATPVAVFVLDGQGAGQVLFFFKKNDTTVAELSLAAITRTSTAKSSGSAAISSPMDAPQEGIVALSTPLRARASRVSPGGQAAAARHHAATHRKDSNRERVYAPTVLGASKRTTKDGLAEVQRLTEGIMVVPKGGVMSRLKAKDDDDEATTLPRRASTSPRLRSSPATGAMSGLQDATRAATAAGAVVVTVNDSSAKKSGTFAVSSADTKSGYLPSHSLNARHNRRMGGKLGNRRRSKRGKPFKKHSTHINSEMSPCSSVREQSYSKAPGPGALEDLSARGGRESMSIEVYRKPSNRRAKVETNRTTRRHRRKKPRMLTSAVGKDTSAHSSEIPSKLQDTVTTTLGVDGSSSETKHKITISLLARTSTVSSTSKFTRSNLIPGGESPMTSTLMKERSTSSRKSNVAPRNAIDSVPLEEVPNKTVQPDKPTAGTTLSRRKEMSHKQNTGHPKTSGFKELTKQSPVVSTTELSAAKSRKPVLLHHKPTKAPSELVSTIVLTRSEPLAITSHTNVPSVTVNDSLVPEEEKFIDFNINENDTLENIQAESSTKHSLQDGKNDKGSLAQSSPGVNGASSAAFVNLKQNASSKALAPVTAQRNLRNSGTGYASDFRFDSQNYTHEHAKFSTRVSAASRITTKGSGATTTSSHIQNSIGTAESEVPKARHAATATNQDTLHAEGKQEVHIAVRTSIKPGEAVSYTDSGSLLEMEVNFLSRNNRTQNASRPSSREESVSLSTHGVSTDSTNQPSARLAPSSRVSKPPVGGAEWFRDGGVRVHSTTGKPVVVVIPSSSGVPNTQGSEKAPRRELNAGDDDDEDDEDDDDDEEDEEDGTSSQSQARADGQPRGPSIVIEIKAATAKAWGNSDATKSTPAFTGQRIAEKFSGKPKIHVPTRSTGSSGRKNANGVLRLGGMLSLNEVTVTDLTSGAKSDQPAPLVNNPEETKIPSPALLNSTERPIVQDPGRLAPINATASRTGTTTLSESAASVNSSRSLPVVKLNSSLNNSDEGSIWRTIIPPKGAATNTTTAVAGLGVENYYDDSKNDTSDRSADASEGRSEPKFENRRIAGEIGSSTRKPGGKPDVFQTEYYYDDPPSPKAELSTRSDVTEPGYGNAPEEEAIDDLFF